MCGTGARINQQLRTGDVIVAGTLYEHDYGSLTRNDMVYRPFNSPANGAEVENKESAKASEPTTASLATKQPQAAR